MQRTRSAPIDASAATSTGVSGLKAMPTASSSCRASAIVLCTSSVVSVWKVTLSPPASATWRKGRSGFDTMRWQSTAPPTSWTIGATALTMTGPIVIGSVKCPSPMSTWEAPGPAGGSNRPRGPGERGEGLGPPGGRGRSREHAEARARSVDENAIEGAEAGRELERIGAEDADVRCAEARGVLLELPGAPGVLLDSDDLARDLCELGGLPPRGG